MSIFFSSNGPHISVVDEEHDSVVSTTLTRARLSKREHNLETLDALDWARFTERKPPVAFSTNESNRLGLWHWHHFHHLHILALGHDHLQTLLLAELF